VTVSGPGCYDGGRQSFFAEPGGMGLADPNGAIFLNQISLLVTKKTHGARKVCFGLD
jgi:hypothetical protein